MAGAPRIVVVFMQNGRRFLFISVFLLFLLGACRREEVPATPAVPDATAESVAPTVTVTPSPAPAESAYLPLTQSNGTTPAADPPLATSTPLPTPTEIPPTPTPAYPRYSGSPLQRDNLGIQIHLHREDMRWLLRHLQALDVGWVKVQVSWKLYQPYPDEYSSERFAELDRLVEAAHNNHIKVLLSVSKAPEWSRSTTERDGPPIDYALFDSFMRHLAARYAGRVAAYELWNEPNLQREWTGAPLSASAFVELIGAGAAGVRAADGKATVISGAPATTGINDGIIAIDDRVYLRGMLAAGVGDLVDAVGVHPYGWANAPDSSAAVAAGAGPTHNNHPSFFFGDTLRDYEQLLAEAGYAEMPLWVTEFGWGSFERFDAEAPAGAEFMNDVTEWEQAEFTLRALQLADAAPQVGPMILWNLNFAPTLGPEFSESGYSVLRPDGSRRPVYLALENATKQ